jgi:hypothetical protein
MVTNSWWIKMDYWVQTVLGVGILVTAVSIVGWFYALVLLGLLGVWQVISGLVGAISGDRLQQIYIVVVAILSLYGIINIPSHSEVAISAAMLISCVIAVWKYTVVRADYISLSIIDAHQIDINNLLDA